MLKKFRDLTEREILALAISSEEEDGRIYGEIASARISRSVKSLNFFNISRRPHALRPAALHKRRTSAIPAVQTEEHMAHRRMPLVGQVNPFQQLGETRVLAERFH